MPDLDELLAVLDLHPTGPGTFRADSMEFGAGAVVFGGQQLAQTIVAAATVDPAKSVKSVHTVFARGASTDRPLEFAVDVMQQGRSFASATVTISQGERLCTRSLVLLHAPDPDLIRHQDAAPEVPSAAESTPSAHGAGFWEVRTVGGVDIADPDAVGPPRLDVWTRFPDAPDDPNLNQALLAFATDGFLIGTAMRPHAGVGQALAHRSISTSVITHTLTFHGPVDASGWLLLDQESPVAGAGRSYGRAHVFAEGGDLVASFVQENMIRAFATDQAPPPGGRAAH
jgi:acyl-CoA thioesterase